MVEEESKERRRFLHYAGSTAMFGGLAASYGTCGLYSARFLFPPGERPKSWQYVSEVGRFKKGEALIYRTPAGEPIAIARCGEAGGADDFIALSSTCPHLGCQVHWEAQNNRFFCPCHNGVFTSEGVAISGPPAEDGRNLFRYPLKAEKGLLFIEVPLPEDEKQATSEGHLEEPNGPPGPGHDPCLYPPSCKKA
jgi:cytochrome b6-f complex iron-sulfur subunit